jgi:hypothetical protein
MKSWGGFRGHAQASPELEGKDDDHTADGQSDLAAGRRAATEEEMQRSHRIMDAALDAIYEELPDPPEEAEAYEDWYDAWVQPRLKTWMDALSYSERLLTRVAMTQARRDLVKEMMEAMVARGELERSPHDPDVYGRPGTRWSKPAPA